jgi:hypothetical protein
MKSSKPFTILLLCALVCAPLALAQSDNTQFKTRAITEWVGERFVFLQRRKALQGYGYQLIHRAKDRYGSLPYDKYVGRIAKVTKVTPSSTFVSGAWNIELVMEDTGEKIVAEAVRNHVEGIAPISDLENARTIYVGKTLWYKKDILESYNQETDKVDYLPLEATPSPVKVIDVVAGQDENHPARFIVETSSGGKGYVDISVGGTNADETLRSYNTFDKFFLTENPYKDSIVALERPIPQGKFKISTKYDRFADTTEAVLEETLARTGETLDGLSVTALAKYQGTQVTAPPKFSLYLSWTERGGSRQPLKFEEAKTIYILTDSDRIQLPVTDYKFHRADIMSWVNEYGTVDLSNDDLARLLKAKTADGRWGDVEFKFGGEGLEALREFVSRLQPQASK